jgi:hypothetical protein
MYNTEKPHKALGKLTPSKFRAMIANNDYSSSNLQLKTVNDINYKRNKITQKTVNVI